MTSYSVGSVSKYNFIAEPDGALQCVICLDVAEDPRQHEECGRLLCKECLEKYGRDKPCPNCRRKQPQYFKDNRGNREINALGVKCSNATSGCEWEGTVGTLEKHMATCGFTLVPCPKQCKEVKCLLKKDLEEHLHTDCPNRDHACQHCGKKSLYSFITKVHDGKCRKKLIACPNAGCEDIIERQQVRKHLRTKCLYAVIPCKYKGIGCDTELKREDMTAHEQDDKLHLHMALDTVNTQQVAIDSLRATVKSLLIKVESQEKIVESQEKTLKVLKNREPKTFRLSEYKKTKEANKQFQFKPFYTHPDGYHMALRVYANGCGDGEDTHVSVFAIIVEGEYDAKLKWPFFGEVTVTLLNQLEDKNHHIKVIPFKPVDDNCIGSVWGYHQFVHQSALPRNHVKETQYLQNDTMYFRVSVEVTDHKPWLE